MENKKRLIDALGLVIKLAKNVGVMVRNGKPQEEIYRKVLECIAEAPTEDAVLRGVHDQVRWERDVAIGQIASYRISLGEKAEVAKVVHGRWLDGSAIHNGKKVYDSIDCSVCEEIFKIESESREYWKERFKVCPFCGAVMDGGNEDA
jgi:hypothetical protein